LPAVKFGITPKNPMVPTVHANWRYFEMYDDSGKVIQQWFGGGQDLPYYLFEEDAIHFHQIVKPLVTNTIEFIQNIKNNVTPISGTHIAMKHVELADCSSIMQSRQK
jgi:coproporphyrinogen III oxidase